MKIFKNQREPRFVSGNLRLQLVLFAVDQVKIDFLRNNVYQFQVWLLFASIVIAHRIAREESERQPVHLQAAA